MKPDEDDPSFSVVGGLLIGVRLCLRNRTFATPHLPRFYKQNIYRRIEGATRTITHRRFPSHRDGSENRNRNYTSIVMSWANPILYITVSHCF